MINSWAFNPGFLTVSWIDYNPYLTSLSFSCRKFEYVGINQFNVNGIVRLLKVDKDGGLERLNGFLSGEKFYIEGKEYEH